MLRGTTLAESLRVAPRDKETDVGHNWAAGVFYSSPTQPRHAHPTA